MPRVSIIIPTYNRARYLAEAIESALAQTYRDFEVIVIDDGSTDNTPEIMRKYASAVRYFRQENQGECAARNTGIKLALGEYISFLDSDDVLLAHCLEKGVAFLDENPTVGFCYGQVDYIDPASRPLWWKRRRGARNSCIRSGRDQIVQLVFRGDIAVNAVIARKACFDQVGLFNPSLHVGGDIEMWMRLSTRYDVGYLAEPLAKVRVHPANITSRRTLEALERSQTAFVERALGYLRDDPDFGYIRKKAYFGLYCYLSEEAAIKGKKAVGLRYLLKALLACPGLIIRWDGFSFLLSVGRGFLPRGLLNFSKQTLAALKLRVI